MYGASKCSNFLDYIKFLLCFNFLLAKKYVQHFKYNEVIFKQLLHLLWFNTYHIVQFEIKSSTLYWKYLRHVAKCFVASKLEVALKYKKDTVSQIFFIEYVL